MEDQYREENIEYFNVKDCGIHSYHYALNGLIVKT
jgi:hypothetical protein